MTIHFPESMATEPGEIAEKFFHAEQGDLVHYAVRRRSSGSSSDSRRFDESPSVGDEVVTSKVEIKSGDTRSEKPIRLFLSNGNTLVVEMAPAEPDVGIPNPYPVDGGVPRLCGSHRDGEPLVDGLDTTK